MANQSIYQFKTGAADITGTDLLRKVEGIAYSGLPLKHDSWGDVIFDLSTTKSAQKIPLLLTHDRNKRVGFTDSVTIARNITFRGSMLMKSRSQQRLLMPQTKVSPGNCPYILSLNLPKKLQANSSTANGLPEPFSGII